MPEDTQKIQSELLAHHTVTYAELPDIELYMDQVVGFVQKQLELFQSAQSERLVTPAILSNGVKSGLIPRPQKKKYKKKHISALLMACTLKQVFPVQQAGELLELYGIDDQQRFNAFANMQDEALSSVARSLASSKTDKQSLGEQIMQLALLANANRLAARMLLSEWMQTKKSPKIHDVMHKGETVKKD